MVRSAVAVGLALILATVVAPSALAADCPCPDPGPEFGGHIASMSPDHPLESDGLLGDMVSHMASDRK